MRVYTSFKTYVLIILINYAESIPIKISVSNPPARNIYHFRSRSGPTPSVCLWQKLHAAGILQTPPQPADGSYCSFHVRHYHIMDPLLVLVLASLGQGRISPLVLVHSFHSCRTGTVPIRAPPLTYMYVRVKTCFRPCFVSILVVTKLRKTILK